MMSEATAPRKSTIPIVDDAPSVRAGTIGLPGAMGFVAGTFRHAVNPFNESEMLACIRCAPMPADGCMRVMTAAP